MLSGIASTVAQGFAFGTGSSLAHHAVDSVLGPRKMEVEHKEAPAAAAAAPAVAAPAAGAGAGPAACAPMQRELARCMEANPGSLAACQGYFDMFNECTKSHKEFM
jgi:hypothetical protein